MRRRRAPRVHRSPREAWLGGRAEGARTLKPSYWFDHAATRSATKRLLLGRVADDALTQTVKAMCIGVTRSAACSREDMSAAIRETPGEHGVALFRD